MDEQKLRDAIEALIDKTTLCAVIDALATVCDEKASHIRETWQDNETARAWDDAGGKLAKLGTRVEGI